MRLKRLLIVLAVFSFALIAMQTMPTNTGVPDHEICLSQILGFDVIDYEHSRFPSLEPLGSHTVRS